MEDNKIIWYLENISGQMVDMSEKIDHLDKKIDKVEASLNEKIDKVEASLNEKIDKVEASLNEKIDKVEATLNEKIDMVEKALDIEVNEVYKIACENKSNIETLLIPFNDRNLSVSAEISKIPEIDMRLNEVEAVVGNHSEAIRKLEAAVV